MIELQQLDCNCNDCTSMIRDIDKYKESLTKHHKWQLDYFNTIRDGLIKKAEEWKLRGFQEKYEAVKKESNKMKFQFNRNEALINYGKCYKFNKEVSFIPNTLQLDTQDCFTHRRL